MANMTSQRTRTYDDLQLMKDAGLVAATAAATVDGAAKIHDVGTSVYEGELEIDVSAVEIATGNELYTVAIQGSSSATFASNIQNLAMIDLGATGARKGGAIDSTVGRYHLPFVNKQDDVVYQYLRVHTTVAGTIATGINFTAWIGQY